MKILFLGDTVGRSGRSAVINNLPTIIKTNKIDFSIVNAENATSGMGLSVKHAKEILEIGADCITLGDHAFDQEGQAVVQSAALHLACRVPGKKCEVTGNPGPGIIVLPGPDARDRACRYDRGLTGAAWPGPRLRGRCILQGRSRGAGSPPQP